jgi:hypothetical protein
MAVGSRVYRPFAPQKPGIVLSNEPASNMCLRRVRVLWMDAKTTDEEMTPRGYNDFDALVDDHRKKLRTHEANLTKLQAIRLAH